MNGTMGKLGTRRRPSTRVMVSPLVGAARRVAGDETEVVMGGMGGRITGLVPLGRSTPACRRRAMPRAPRGGAARPGGGAGPAGAGDRGVRAGAPRGPR